MTDSRWELLAAASRVASAIGCLRENLTVLPSFRWSLALLLDHYSDAIRMISCRIDLKAGELGHCVM